jgi:hypothetical protein
MTVVKNKISMVLFHFLFAFTLFTMYFISKLKTHLAH